MIPVRYGTEQFLFALAIWRAAGGETATVRVAVGWTVFNRVQRSTWRGRTIWQVIRKDWLYAGLIAPEDPQLALWPSDADESWEECWQLADDLISGKVTTNPFPGADSYYEISRPAPKWASAARFCGRLGRLLFYDANHDWQATEPSI